MNIFYKKMNNKIYKYYAGRGIARIDYDRLNNPVRIQFTNGSVTKYVYSAAGEKLRVTHLTAVPNITVAVGSVRELAPAEILSADSTDYLLGGSLTLRNGRIDKLQFEEGYCQASAYSGNASQDDIYFYYYDRDHLGNIRQVVLADRTTNGTVVQTMDYYPFGAQFCHSSTASEVQSRKYNGKELDRMHGLDTYDYGARQYTPILGRRDRMDPLCEKYYNISPYAYCGNNPVMMVDPDGRDGIATIDYDNNTITISQTFYYNRNSEGLNRNGFVKDIETKRTTYIAEISLLGQSGFSSKTWNVNDGSNDWSVSFSYNFIGLDSDEEVKNALDSNLAANALCYKNTLQNNANGTWDQSERTLSLTSYDGLLGSGRGETFFHEIGHSWGLPHEKYMSKSPMFGVEKNGEGVDHTGIMGSGNHRAIQQYEVEYGVKKLLNEIPENHSSTIEHHIKGCDYK